MLHLNSIKHLCRQNKTHNLNFWAPCLCYGIVNVVAFHTLYTQKICGIQIWYNVYVFVWPLLWYRYNVCVFVWPCLCVCLTSVMMKKSSPGSPCRTISWPSSNWTGSKASATVNLSHLSKLSVKHPTETLRNGMGSISISVKSSKIFELICLKIHVHVG